MQILQNFFDYETLDIIVRLVVAILCGIILGTERVRAHKTTGMRTYALVALGSALFTVISSMMIAEYKNFAGINPMHIVAQIIVGVGFLGTGVIFTRDSKLMGMTTATGLWVSAGIGIASGLGYFKLAFIATFFTLFIFTVLWFIEEQIRKSKFFGGDTDDESKVQ